MADTNLAQAIEAANDSNSYDTNIKFLLADKQILARILKYAVQEFNDIAVSEIMSSIGNDIDVGTKPLDSGLSNIGRINASNAEDNIPGEGKIFFDIRFTAYHKKSLPSGKLPKNCFAILVGFPQRYGVISYLIKRQK